ncbi:Putative nudix hydrolase 6 [Trichuris trichiura]|uniref:Putative nudix hydrolase 6 n=1 Tax=Trichuris trichiura TaxID=36087 RepID=A0A077ZL53_TRITR|nr:Putative nudix hydrolase 6 [Trichuris trichiura]
MRPTFHVNPTAATLVASDPKRFRDPLFKPRFNVKDGKIDRRRVRTDCGRLTYPVQKGIPANPAGITGYSGLGLFRRWGPNVYMKVLIVRGCETEIACFKNLLIPDVACHFRRENNQVYVLWKKNGTSFFKGFVDDTDEAFPEPLFDLFTRALYMAKVERPERTALIQEARKSSKLYISGSVPHPWNTDNAWLEINNYVLRCDKNPTLCIPFLRHVRHDYEWRPWEGMHTVKQLLAELRRYDIQGYHVTPDYSAYCMPK